MDQERNQICSPRLHLVQCKCKSFLCCKVRITSILHDPIFLLKLNESIRIIIYLLLFRINFEFPSTGGILTEATFETAKLLRYLSRTDYALLGKSTRNHFYIINIKTKI